MMACMAPPTFIVVFPCRQSIRARHHWTVCGPDRTKDQEETVWLSIETPSAEATGMRKAVYSFVHDLFIVASHLRNISMAILIVLAGRKVRDGRPFFRRLNLP